MRTAVTPCLLLLTAGLSACHLGAVRPPRPPENPTALRYNVTYERDPEHALEVEVVLSNGEPRNFLFTQDGGVKTVWAYLDSGEAVELPVEHSGVELPPGTRYLRYRFPLDAMVRRRGADFFAGLPQGDARLITGRTWMIRPRVAKQDLRVELSVQGVNALLPWRRGPGGMYQLRGDDLVDSGFHGFGGRRCEVVLPEAALQVGILGDMTYMRDAQLCDWLRRTANEVRTVRHPFPYPRVTVLIYPVPGRTTADVFGMVMWSSPPSIALLVGQDAEPSSFQDDWVAIHELLHLTHPPFSPPTATRWITEGLATYYTELARARSGRLTPEQAWRELLHGFELGRSQASGRTTREMIEENDPPGIYWVGAFFALRLDVELRRATGNQRGLEDVLELLATQKSTTNMKGYSAAVDAVAGRPLFEALLERELREPAFASLGGLLEELGVIATSSGVKLRLAQDSKVREALHGLSASSGQ
jgi:hypothetical protein